MLTLCIKALFKASYPFCSRLFSSRGLLFLGVSTTILHSSRQPEKGTNEESPRIPRSDKKQSWRQPILGWLLSFVRLQGTPSTKKAFS